MNNVVFWKPMENVKKNMEILNCNNSGEKKLFSMRTKLSYYKVFQGKCIGNRNEENSNTNE